MTNRGSSIPKHHCSICDFGTDKLAIFDDHFTTQYHKDAVLARNREEILKEKNDKKG